MKKWVVANWKMNGSVKLLQDYQRAFFNSENFIVCPPAIYLNNSTSLPLGAQNIHYESEGAYTGEISVSMLADIGVRYCLVGHSERRQYFSETNAQIRAKSSLCLENAITPIICIGESLGQYEAGKTLEVLETQLKECLPDAEGFWIAYEPVWAIGTGLTPSPEEIFSVHAYLREKLSSTKLLYGGSVNEQNVSGILANSNVEGVLVGGASLILEKISFIHRVAIS